MRNAKSDDAMFASAVATNDSATYRAYLEHGTRHASEVSSLLMPRALLRDAEATGTVDAIEQFLKDHPGSSVADEATAALRRALLAELGVAANAGTLAALDDFTRRRPGALVDADVKRARHAVYVAAQEHYVAQAPEKAPAAVAFVQRLLAWSERSGPHVELRFRRRHSKTLDRADGATAQSRQFKGVVSMPSRYFDEQAEKDDVAALATAISQRFAETFPPEILALSVGEALPDTDMPWPARIAVPTLFVEHGVVWAGAIQASLKPRGVYVGLELSFDASFRLPDDAKGVATKVDGWHQPKLAAAADAEHPEDAVYGEMRHQAFEQFQSQLLAVFFRPTK